MALFKKSFRYRKNKLLYFSIAFFIYSTSYAQQDSLKGLQNEVFLHPADGFSAYTLKKNEIIYNQSPFTLPLPSWAWWGITDNITAEIDLLPIIGGLFQKPHLPVPSFNFRFKLREQKGIIPSIAYETMYQHLWNVITQSDQPNAIVKRKGNSWFNHINFSWKVRSKFFIHFSTGATYVENLFLSNNDSLNLIEKFYPKSFTPDFNLSFDYRIKSWISFNATMAYGSTFVYLDNIPRKQQLSYGFRIAPFYKNKRPFLTHLRAEFIGFFIHLPDINESIISVLPIFPYFYWQWNFQKKKK